MQILAPIGLAALGLIPPLVLLYFLKLKRVPVQISSSLLWSKALLDSRANAPFQKLRRNILLLLQILVLCLVAFALARPALNVHGRAARSTVIVIDGSASMAAKDAKPSRFEKAKDEARSVVGEIGGNDEAMIVWAGPRPRVAASFGHDKTALRSAIDALDPADASADLKSALQLGMQASEGRGAREIVLITDGAFDPIQDLALGDVPVRYVKVGESGENVAIVAVDVRRRAGGARQGFLSVANYGATEADFDLEVRLRPEDVSGDGTLLELKPMTVPAGGERSEVFDVPEEGGLLQATISEGGALSADDRVYVAIPSQGKIDVGLVGGQTSLVRRALEADPRLRVKEGVSPVEALTSDVGVFVGTRPPSYDKGRILLIDPVDGGGLFAVSGPAPDPGPVHWEPQHPLTRYTALGDVHIGTAVNTTPPPGALVLAEAGPAPVIWAYERPRLKLVVLSFDPFESDFPLRAGFPIFLGNAVDWLMQGRGVGPRVVAAGEIARGDLEDEKIASVTITDPKGEAREVPVHDGEWIYDGTTHAGIYTIEAAGKKSRFAVNLLSRSESDVRPRATLALGSSKVKAEEGGKTKRRLELWPWLALAAIGMLTSEWYVFHRRGA